MKRIEMSEEERKATKRVQSRARQRRWRARAKGIQVVALCEAAVEHNDRWEMKEPTRVPNAGADNPLHRKAERAVIQPFRNLDPPS